MNGLLTSLLPDQSQPHPHKQRKRRAGTLSPVLETWGHLTLFNHPSNTKTHTLTWRAIQQQSFPRGENPREELRVLWGQGIRVRFIQFFLLHHLMGTTNEAREKIAQLRAAALSGFLFGSGEYFQLTRCLRNHGVLRVEPTASTHQACTYLHQLQVFLIFISSCFYIDLVSPNFTLLSDSNV